MKIDVNIKGGETVMRKVRRRKDFRCEVYGMLGMLQIFPKNYARVRHIKA